MPIVHKTRDASSAVREINPLGDPSWDASLTALPGASCFHGSAWMRVLHETYGYKPTCLVLGESGRWRAMLPLMEVDSWLTGRRGIGLPFTDECTPLCPDPGDFALLHQAALSRARQRKWRYLEYRGGRRLLGDPPASTTFHGHTLSLSPDETTLFAGTDPAVRRAVRKAEQSGLTLTFTKDLHSLRVFHGLLGLTRRRHGLPVQPFTFFAGIHRHLLACGQGLVILAHRDTTPVAGAVFFHHQGTALYKFGASDERLQHLRANNLVMWEAIKWHRREGFARLDFGRTSLGNAGLRRFKLGWGAVERTIDYVRLDAQTGSPMPAPDESSGWYNPIFRQLPLPLARLAGSVLYKHVA